MSQTGDSRREIAIEFKPEHDLLGTLANLAVAIFFALIAGRVFPFLLTLGMTDA
ncbi:MAG: hypothetical protein GVY06_11410 [Alphaproteobacteria bacterium]|nr:hypothetical protein [Alphaproteobacteria bacterium]